MERVLERDAKLADLEDTSGKQKTSLSFSSDFQVLLLSLLKDTWRRCWSFAC
jgi:hypothetical protein